MQSHITDIAPDFQGRESLLPKSNPTDQSIPSNSKASIPNVKEGNNLISCLNRKFRKWTEI